MPIKLTIRKDGDASHTPPLIEKVFDEPIITIGSDESSILRLNGSAVASEQAVIVIEMGEPLLINQADGTTLNDEALTREARRLLVHGDRLRIGGYVIELALHDIAAPPAVASSASEDEATTPAPEGGPRPRPAAPPPLSFAELLDSLRTEEDSFYFLIQGGEQAGARIPLEGANVELPLGWNETRQAIRFDAAARPHAIVRKDWSGVIIEAQPGAELTINDEPLAGARRLRDGDRVALAAPEAAAGAAGAVLIFHEPASLIVLDSLFSQKIPPPVVSAQAANHRRAETGPAGAHDAPRARRAPDLANDRKYFGVFTQLEMLAMGVSTLLLSVLIFLMLSIFAGP